jgi:simple sugar transport system permease protein
VETTLATIVASASPLVYAAIGETITEKAGVVNLSLEGTLRLAAMTAFGVSVSTGNPLLGFLAAAGVGAIIAAIVAFAGIELRLNQIAVGFVLTLLAIELSSFLGDPYVGRQGHGVPAMSIPLLSEIPFLGKVLFRQNLSVYGSYVVIVGAYLFLFRTRRGLEMQGVGERPEAAHARGIDVNRLRYLYTTVGGALAGIGGAAVSLDVQLGWREGLTAKNLGWIALAIVIFGGWNPIRAAFGAYLFGVLSRIAGRLQPVFPSLSQILPLLPFVLMIFALVLVYLQLFRELADRHPILRRFLSAEPPSGLGTAFHRE